MKEANSLISAPATKAFVSAPVKMIHLTSLSVSAVIIALFSSEIVDAFKKVKNKINTKSLSKGLYTKNMANPDILIRTGGHKRLSNFMLWQLAYTEIYFVDKLWPDFNGKDFEKITNNFKKVKRNFGSI